MNQKKSCGSRMGPVCGFIGSASNHQYQCDKCFSQGRNAKCNTKLALKCGQYNNKSDYQYQCLDCYQKQQQLQVKQGFNQPQNSFNQGFNQPQQGFNYPPQQEFNQFNQPPQQHQQQQGFNQPQQGFNQPPQQGFNQPQQGFNQPPQQGFNQPAQQQQFGFNQPQIGQNQLQQGFNQNLSKFEKSKCHLKIDVNCGLTGSKSHHFYQCINCYKKGKGVKCGTKLNCTCGQIGSLSQHQYQCSQCFAIDQEKIQKLFTQQNNQEINQFGQYNHQNFTNAQPSQVRQNEKECVICMCSKPTMAFVNCGHLITCEKCCNSFMNGQCPLCRTPVQQKILRIYQ